jgi:osmotically-inducible protein OsmY
VTARDGVVTLSGTLPGKGMIPVAVRLASDADGVVAVHDKLSSGVPRLPREAGSGVP